MKNMKKMYFTRRCFLEILRDPLSSIFGIGFPVVLLLLLSLIQANIPVSLFEPAHLTPGIVVFGFSFLALFTATLVSRDRTSSFLVRLYASPLKADNFLLGYTIPLLPMALIQTIISFAVAMLIGLKPTANILLCMAVCLPAAVLYISLGLLFGSLLNDKQVGGICGALLTNLSAWLSGTWFDLSLMGNGFRTAAYALPFANAVDAARAALSGNYEEILIPLLIVCGYALAVAAAAVAVFRKKMKA